MSWWLITTSLCLWCSKQFQQLICLGWTERLVRAQKEHMQYNHLRSYNASNTASFADRLFENQLDFLWRDCTFRKFKSERQDQQALTLFILFFTSPRKVSMEENLPRIMVQLLGYVIHHVIFWCFMGHGFAEFAGHQCFSHSLLSVLPKEEGHLLALHKHCPHHQLVERKGKMIYLRVIQININFFFSFLSCFPPSS